MGQTSLKAVAARRIDDDEAVAARQRLDLSNQRFTVRRLVFSGRVIHVLDKIAMVGNFQAKPRLLGPGVSILDVVSEGLLRELRSRVATVWCAFINATVTCMATVDSPDPPFSLPTTITRAREA